MIPWEDHSYIINDLYSSLPKFPSAYHPDIPSRSEIHSNIPSEIYSSLPKLVPRLLPAGMLSSDYWYAQNYTPSLEPGSSSSLEN